MIIIHYTGMESASVALERLCDPKSEVSAHYVIEENGTMHALVPEEKRAWHAGVSYWRGKSDINSASIGVELVNPGTEHGYSEFPYPQMKALEQLCIDLIDSYDIKAENIVGHSDVAPGRKIDPGEHFPWEILALKGIGVWPVPERNDSLVAEKIAGDEERVKEQLVAYGYNPEVDLKTLTTEFHRHFCPEKFEGTENPGEFTPDSLAKLVQLTRLRESAQ